MESNAWNDEAKSRSNGAHVDRELRVRIKKPHAREALGNQNNLRSKRISRITPCSRDFGQIRGENIAGGGEVAGVDHLGDGVDIASADGDTNGSSASGGLLGGCAILPACGEDGALIGDFVFLGQGLELIDEVVIRDEGAVLDVKPVALALDCYGFLAGDAWGVAGEGDVEADADIGKDGVAGSFRAAKAYFFLDGEGDDDLAGVAEASLIKGANALNSQPASDAIVHGFGDCFGAHGDKGFVHDDVVADLDLLLNLVDGEADVDEELFNFGNFFTVLGAGDVDGAAAWVHDAEEIARVGTDQHAAREEVSRVESACWVDPDEALVIDGRDIETDLVHVAKKHDAGGAT